MGVDRTLLPNLGDLFLEGHLVPMMLHIVSGNLPGKGSPVHRIVLLNKRDRISFLKLGDRSRLNIERRVPPQLVRIKSGV